MRLRNVMIIIGASCAQAGFAQYTWTAQNSGVTDTLRTVQFLDASNGYTAGNNGKVLKTTDGGTTWTDVSISTSNPVRSLSFINASTGWAAVGDVNSSGSSGEVWTTTDGGSNWTQQTSTPSTEARLGISFVDASNGWVCGSKSGPMEVWHTSDGGANYAAQGNGNVFGWMYGIDAFDASNVWTVGNTFYPSPQGLIIASTDGGASWTDVTSGTPPFIYSIDMVDANNVFVAGDAGTLLSTTDGGSNWNTLTSGTSEILWGISFAYLTYGLACGENGTMISTTDGSAWSAENTGNSESYYGVFMLDSVSAWAVGSNGTIIKRILGTGLDEGSLAPDVRVYPNPFNTQTNISIGSGFMMNGTAELQVFNIIGETVRRVDGINSNNYILQRENLAPGIYTYSIKSGEHIAVGKLIIE
ncbi:MAG: YCF48-related protein [Flavobacteriales bacterium]